MALKEGACLIRSGAAPLALAELHDTVIHQPSGPRQITGRKTSDSPDFTLVRRNSGTESLNVTSMAEYGFRREDALYQVCRYFRRYQKRIPHALSLTPTSGNKI